MVNGLAILLCVFNIGFSYECRMHKANMYAYFKDASSGDYDNFVCVIVAMIDKFNK